MPEMKASEGKLLKKPVFGQKKTAQRSSGFLKIAKCYLLTELCVGAEKALS